MTDVFISYAKEDAPRIERLARALKLQGLEVFWDRKIPGGMSWREYIGTALTSAKCVTVAWSEHSIKSAWVNEEADYGKDRGILVPLLLGTVKPPLGFGGLQAIDLTEWDGDASTPEFEQLLTDIGRVSGVKPNPGLTNHSLGLNEAHSGHAHKSVVGALHELGAKLRRVWALVTTVVVAAVAITWLIYSQMDLPETHRQSIGPSAIEPQDQTRQGADSASPSPPAPPGHVSQNRIQPGIRYSPEGKPGPYSRKLEEMGILENGRVLGPPSPKDGAVGLFFDLLQPDGAFVKSVRPNGPSEVAGILAGDIITAIDGKVVLNGAEAEKLVRAAAPGARLTIAIERGGITLAFRVTVEKYGREEAEFLSSMIDVDSQTARSTIRRMNR